MVRMLPVASVSGLTTSAFSVHRTAVARKCIALLAFLFGFAGLALLPSSLLESTAEFTVVSVCAVSAFIFGVLWLIVPWSGRFDRAIVLYADIGIALVLLSFRLAFPAFAGVGLLIVVSVFVLLFCDTITLLVHTVATLALTAYLGITAIQQGADAWGVASQAISLMCGSLVPVVVLLYRANESRQIGLAQRDPETGLRNRVGLDLSVVALTAAYPLKSALVAVSMTTDGVGPDRTKRDVLEVTESIRTLLPTEAILARTATMEFLLCILVDDRAAGLASIIDLQARLSGRPVHDDRLVSGSAIVDLSSRDGRTAVGWSVQRAISAAELRRNERSGSAVIAPTDEMREAASRINAVIAGGGPDIVFQPICRADDESVVGYESLSRFSASGGSTADWFAAAADTGLGAALDRSAIENAIRESTHLPPGAFVSVNLAAATLLIDSDLTTLLIHACASRPVVVEITEHAAIDEHSAVRAALTELRRGGVAIAVDDVGAGHAGLRQLVLIEPDIVKLDAFVVHEMEDDLTRLAAAEFILAFARKTGARCVFEGIETESDLAAARSIGADLLQGYLLGRPAPAGAARAL